MGVFHNERIETLGGKTCCLTAFTAIHQRELTWNSKMEVWKMIILFNFVFFGFHVNFQGCTVFVMIEKESSFT